MAIHAVHRSFFDYIDLRTMYKNLQIFDNVRYTRARVVAISNLERLSAVISKFKILFLSSHVR